MKIEEVRRILVVGAGTIGRQISLQCAMHSYDVVVYDIAPDSLKNARVQIKRYAAQLVSEGHLTQEAADAAVARITFTHNPEEAAAEVDLLSESVPEDPDLKGKVFAQFNKLCPPRTIFTTNTSMLIPSMFAKATGRPAQFAALHFHQYVWESNVVDVMPHPGTSEETVELLLAFAKRIGQIPIFLKKENYGYVFNAMLSSVNREALILAANGVASVEDIDRAYMGVTKASIGPFGILDRIGLKTVLDINKYFAKALRWSISRRYLRNQIQKNADFLKEYVDKGWLGVKSGRGFYTYPNPAYQQPGFLTGERARTKKK